MTTTSPAKSSPVPIFTIDHEFPVPLDRLWTAFVDPVQLEQWWGPKGMSVTHSRMDLRPGGHYHYGLQMPDGSALWGLWAFSRIVPRQRLEFISTFSDEQAGGPTRHPWEPDWPLEVLTEIDFSATVRGSRVEVRWVPVNATRREIDRFAAAREECRAGWNGTFEKLEAFLTDA